MRLATSLVLVWAVAAAGCGDADPAARDPHGPRVPESAPAAGHHHTAPHGGTLVELEAEALNLELLADPTEGVLTAWILDGHCEHPVRIVQEEIDLTLDVGGTAVHVRLGATENALTGEKKGDTSEFRGAHEVLRGIGDFSGVVRSVRVGPRAFQNVKFRYACRPQ